MKRLVLLFCMFIIAGCTDVAVMPKMFTETSIVDALREQNVPLNDVTSKVDDLFFEDLNGVTPLVYEFEETLLMIFVFDTVDARKQAQESFYENPIPSTSSGISIYQQRNLFMLHFYINSAVADPSPLPYDSNITNAIQNALTK